MAWTSGFFNSVNNDRLYNAETINKMFEGLISDGVFESIDNKLAVQPNSGMTIQIATGRGYFNHHWVKNTSEKLLTLEASDVVLNRYGAVVVKVDETTPVREVVPYIKYSNFASNPVKPTMTRSATVNEYCLAYVYIPAKATTITASNIEDTRFNNELCGWVTGLITQVSTTTLYEQWEDIFTTWFDGIEGRLDGWEDAFRTWFRGLQDLIDENVETKLVGALPTSVNVTLPVNGWTQVTGGYTQEVLVMNMNTTKIVLVQPTGGKVVECIGQNTNSLTFKVAKLPTEALTVNVTHMGI